MFMFVWGAGLGEGGLIDWDAEFDELSVLR